MQQGPVSSQTREPTSVNEPAAAAAAEQKPATNCAAPHQTGHTPERNTSRCHMLTTFSLGLSAHHPALLTSPPPSQRGRCMCLPSAVNSSTLQWLGWPPARLVAPTKSMGCSISEEAVLLLSAAVRAQAQSAAQHTGPAPCCFHCCHCCCQRLLGPRRSQLPSTPVQLPAAATAAVSGC
jgi:hypothetical protein